MELKEFNERMDQAVILLNGGTIYYSCFALNIAFGLVSHHDTKLLTIYCKEFNNTTLSNSSSWATVIGGYDINDHGEGITLFREMLLEFFRVFMIDTELYLEL